MQSELKEKSKIIEETLKPKKKEFSPVEQWDQLAFSVVYNELAPKGFKKVNHGHYRGTECSNLPILSKKRVQKVQKIAAQLVRGFRDKTKKEFQERLDAAKPLMTKYQTEWKECAWFRLKKKRLLRNKGEYYQALVDSYSEMIKVLENVSIK
jgi:hypothetical protein